MNTGPLSTRHPRPDPEDTGKLVQASGSLMPTPFPTAQTAQESAPRRHQITDPRIEAKPPLLIVGGARVRSKFR